MKNNLELYSHNDNKIKKYYGYALMLLAASMLYTSQIIGASLIILSVLWLLEGKIVLKWILFKQRPLILIFCLFYLLFLAGMLYTQNVEVGKSNLEKKIAVFVIPLVIGTSSSFNSRLKQQTLAAFVVSCLLGSLVCLGNAAYHYWHEGITTYFFNDELSYPAIDLQAVYFGMFTCFSILIILFYLRHCKNALSSFQKVASVLLVVYFFCFLILLSARTSTLFLLLFFLTGGLYSSYKRRRIGWGIITLIIAVGVATLIITQSAFLKDRIVKPLTSDITITGGGEETGLSMRMVKWKCSIEGILKNPLFGVGTGDAVDYLASCYEREKFWGALPQYRYNSHNQYLQITLTLGLIGLTCFLLCLIIPIIYAWKEKQFLFLSFLLLFGFCSLTESTIEREWGLIFFSFFVSIFSFSNRPYEKDVTNK